jgi:hypothetical protein
MHLARRPVAERGMRPMVVVIGDPRCNPILRASAKPSEQALSFSKLVAHAPVEALHEAVLHRLARRDEVPGDARASSLHFSIAFEVNSVPWSETIISGFAPRRAITSR